MKKYLSLFLAFIIILYSPLVVNAKEGKPTTIKVFRKSNICAVYDSKQHVIRSFPVSTGKPGHETPLGNYKIYQHTDGGDYHPMEDGTFGRFCMRFKEGGFMFHSVCYAEKNDKDPIPEEVAAIGTSASLGCVRLRVADAKWLYYAIPNGCPVVIIDY